MCIFCSSAHITGSNNYRPQWGLSKAMCEVAFGTLTSKVIAEKAQVDKTFVDDYARIYSVMLDRPGISNKLKALANSISADANSATGETNWLRLSSILTYYEKKCWFPEDVLLPMGVLSSDVFYHYIRCGCVLKDYRAGVKHGEFTHRLQWHAIMAVATMDFTRPIAPNWGHSPFELYVSLGKPENMGIWTLLLDNRGEGPLTHPDSFHAWVLETAPPKLVGFLVKRETKRREQFIDDICRYIAQQAKLGVIYNFPDIFLPNQWRDPKISHDDFKAFEKWFVDDLRERYDETTVDKIYNSLADQNTPTYVARKTADPTTLADLPKHRKKAYVPLTHSNVYELSGRPRMNEKAADYRASASRTNLL
jgi:hypothetical protein